MAQRGLFAHKSNSSACKHCPAAPKPGRAYNARRTPCTAGKPLSGPNSTCPGCTTRRGRQADAQPRRHSRTHTGQAGAGIADAPAPAADFQVVQHFVAVQPAHRERHQRQEGRGPDDGMLRLSTQHSGSGHEARQSSLSPICLTNNTSNSPLRNWRCNSGPRPLVTSRRTRGYATQTPRAAASGARRQSLPARPGAARRRSAG